jgi:Putative peptidoglycan binding domain
MGGNRTIVLLGVLALAAVSAAGGWVAASRIESPAEAAARTAAPTPSPILVPVEERILSSSIVTRGTARFGSPQPVSIAPSALKANAPGLVTTLPTRDVQFEEGDVMFTASGRPVLVLQGEIPAYRDLVPGTVGDDVRQLEQGLKRLGFEPGPADGTYDQTTSAAVGELYKSAGYEPFLPTAEQLAAVRALDAALADATRNEMLAAATAAAASLAVEAARRKAHHAHKAAAADVAAGIAERAAVAEDQQQPAASRSAADAKVEAGHAALRAAEVEGELAVQAALEAKKVAEFDALSAAGRLAATVAELEKARRGLGVQLPLDEIVFIPGLPVRVQEVTAQVGDAATGPVLSVTNNQMTVDSSVALDTAPLMKPGMEVLIDEPAFGIKTKGVVEEVADTPGTGGVDGYHVYFAVRVGETPAPLDGFSLRLTIPVKSTKGAVTTVPTSALSLAADGTSRVQVEDEGSLAYVVVEPGLAASGYVEVTARDGLLKPGQLVVVGQDNSGKKAAQPDDSE